MPLPFLASFAEKYFPQQYFLHIVTGVSVLLIARSYSQGRKTTRERDLHGRVVLLTGGFTATGSTLLEALARRGAHIIALAPDPIEEPHIKLVIEALQETTNNQKIFAEHCDLFSTESVKAFCTKFLTGQETRLDALVFLHEFEHVGPMFISAKEREACEKRRAAASDATFLITTLLLPTLLVAPPERDIRLINVVNPFYAAALPFFPNAPSRKSGSQLVHEGFRALRSIVLTRHWQRVFDALPAAPAPEPDAPDAAASAGAKGQQKSNIVAVSVSPGFSRADTIAPLLRAKRDSHFSLRGLILYLLLLPVLYLFAKSSSSAVETILHALFLPTPFKRKAAPKSDKGPLEDTLPEEILKPGALYSSCSVVQLRIKAPKVEEDEKKEKDKEPAVIDDKEYGGEALGRMVWESYEESLKARGEGVSSTPTESSSTEKKNN